MQMRRVHVLASVAAAGTLGIGCPRYANVQCIESSNCDLHFGGVCTTAPTGNHWCAYPDPICPNGYRYSDLDTGDGVSGQCVGAGVDATAQPATSCIALPHTCGANRNDDCCSSLSVTGGSYFRSYDVADDGNFSDKSAPATISGFRLDKYEVTVARFRAFVEQDQGTQSNPPVVGSGTHPHLPGSGWQAPWTQNLPADKAALIAGLACDAAFQTWTDTPYANENKPMNCLSWYEAAAFCAWDGGFLPTEAEWNYAAAGGDEQRAYPWSDPARSTSIDSSRGSYSDTTGCIGDGQPACTRSDLLDVGSRPAGDGR